MKCYQPGYPRPQFVRNPESWESLDGQWDFAFDDSNEGIAKKWFAPSAVFPAGKKITVSFTYETPASGIGESARHDVVWYRREIAVDAAKKRQGKVFVHFEGSDYHTRLYVNGAFAGEHSGGYARFSFDITHLVKAGNNTFVVRVEDSPDLAQPRGKQRWKEDNFGCWYVQTTGIWKTLWLEYVNAEHIESVKMTPVLSEGRLKIEALVNACFGNDIELEAAVSFKDKAVNRVTVPVTEKRLEFCVDVASLNISEWGVHAWSPENPNLYDISFTLKRNGKILDGAGSYFGMRDIRIDGANVLLNGHPLYQRLILDQGYWKDTHLTAPSEEALIADIDKLLSAGYNGVRKHQKIEDERFLYWADVKGFLVWSEAPAAYVFNDDAVTNFTREWMEIVRQNYNHPAIITWTPFNESWGVSNIKTEVGADIFMDDTRPLNALKEKIRKTLQASITINPRVELHENGSLPASEGKAVRVQDNRPRDM